jgi:hypothetical protein
MYLFNRIIIVLAASLAATLAHADPAMVINPAVGCSIADGNLFTGPLIFVNSDDARIVATQSRNGNAVYKCKLSDIANDTGAAVNYDFQDILDFFGAQFPCVIFNPVGGADVTENWKVTISSRGKATLTCKFRN